MEGPLGREHQRHHLRKHPWKPALSAVGFCLFSGDCSRNWKEKVHEGKGTEGKHQASGPSWPCLSREDFFLTQRLKCFYLKRLFTFQSPKKKKRQPSSRPISVPSRVTDTASELLRGTFLALSLSCWGDSHLPPASRDCATLRRPGWGGKPERERASAEQLGRFPFWTF